MDIEYDLLNVVEERFKKNIYSLKVLSRSEILGSQLSKKDKKQLRNLSEEEIVEQRDKLLEHSQIVRQIALDICRMIDNITENERSLIESAALLHDVEKVFLEDYDEDHTEKGAKYIKRNWNNFLRFFSDDEKTLICLMIRWHKDDEYGARYNELYYSKKQIRMIEIVRIADKISKVYKKDEYEKVEDIYYKIKENIKKLQDENVKDLAYNVLSENLVSRFKKLYLSGDIEYEDLNEAVEKKLITESQKKEIDEE